jgi:hypothetical protein
MNHATSTTTSTLAPVPQARKAEVEPLALTACHLYMHITPLGCNGGAR